MLRRFIAILSTCAVFLSLAGCGSEISDIVGPSINIGIAYDRPGMSLLRNGMIGGFNVEIAQEIAYDLGYSSQQIHWIETDKQQEDDLFETGKIDILVGSSVYDHTAESYKSEFAGPYMTSSLAIMSRHSVSKTMVNLKDLQAKRVCMVEGEFPDIFTPQTIDMLKSQMKQVFMQTNYSQCFSALATATVDAIVGDSVVLSHFAHYAKGQNFTVQKISDMKISYGISMPHGDVRLKEKIQKKLSEMVKDPRCKAKIADLYHS